MSSSVRQFILLSKWNISVSSVSLAIVFFQLWSKLKLQMEPFNADCTAKEKYTFVKNKMENFNFYQELSVDQMYESLWIIECSQVVRNKQVNNLLILVKILCGYNQ